MAARGFERQLGSQSGIQLGALKDRTESGALRSPADQVGAIVMRCKRGRIDRPFRVARGNWERRTGKRESIAINQLNEAQVHLFEALAYGAREVVVSRLTVAAASISWVAFLSAATATFSAGTTLASTNYTIAMKHLGCHNDGIVVKVHADAVKSAGVDVATKVVTVQVLDADGNELLKVKGSLDPAAVDDSNRSYYLADVAAALTDDFVFDIPAGATIQPTHAAYGRDANGKDKWASSGTLICFSEGGTGYATADYERAVNALRNGSEDFGYIISAGTRSTALLSKLIDLEFEMNRPGAFDVPGDLTPAQAATWMAQLSIGGSGRDHYPAFYWAPILRDDPLNGGRAYIGFSGQQIGMRCGRNAQVNAYGLAPKNYPIAGKAWPVGGTGLREAYAWTDRAQELSDLADAKINPVVAETYASGTAFVFLDSLTAAATTTSYRKLTTVADMSADLDNAVVRYGKECLQLPQAESIKRLNAFLEKLFSAALASGWLVTGGKSPEGQPLAPYAYNVQRVPGREADQLLVEYWLHYDGVNRQTYVQQTIV